MIIHVLLVVGCCDKAVCICHYSKHCYFVVSALTLLLPPVLWCCWLGGRKGIWPVKNWVVGCCLEQGAGLHMAQLMPLPFTVLSVKSTLVLPFWYRLTWVVPEKVRLNGCVCECALTLLVGHQEEHLACKNWMMWCSCGYLSGVRCRFFEYSPADAIGIQNPAISCLI